MTERGEWKSKIVSDFGFRNDEINTRTAASGFRLCNRVTLVCVLV